LNPSSFIILKTNNIFAPTTRYIFIFPLIGKKKTKTMIKKLQFTLLFCFLALAGRSQMFNEGKIIGQVGLGVASPYYYSGTDGLFPPIHLSAEYGIDPNISVGGIFGYAASRYKHSDYRGTYSYRLSYRIFGARGSYHFYNTEDMDIYAGAMLGVNISNSSLTETSGIYNTQVSDKPTSGGVVLGAYAGMRYRLNNNIAAFGEIGYSVSWVTLGVAFMIDSK